MRTAATILTCMGLISLPAAASTAPKPVDRVAIAGPGVTSAFPHGVAVELHSPPGYARDAAAGDAGSWTGPEYRATGNPSNRGHVSIRWHVRFAHGYRSAHAAAWAGLEEPFAYLRKDPIAVPHVVGGRVIGTIVGFTVMTRGREGHDASYEGSLAFPVARRAYALVQFVLDSPPSDSAGADGRYLVNGDVSPSTWEHGQAFWSFTGVRLVGKLPPRKVLVGVRGHRLHGSVHDYFKSPVPWARLALERRTKHGWAVVERGRATKRGRFSLRYRRHGVYRVSARLRGARAASRTLFLGVRR